MFEQILAYTFIALFSGIVVFGHVMLFRDIFVACSSSEPDDEMSTQSKQRRSMMRHKQAA